MTKWLTVEEVAKRLQCSRDSVVRKLHAGMLRWRNISNGQVPRYQIDINSLQEYEQSIVHK